MGKRFHIGDNGPFICKVDPSNPNSRGCPFGGESGNENHFDSMEEAKKVFESRMEKESGLWNSPLSREDSREELDRKRRTFTVPTYNAKRAEKKIEALNRRIQRSGGTELFTFTREDETVRRHPTQIEMERYGYSGNEVIEEENSIFTLSRPRISVGNWEFQAVFDRIEGTDDFITRSAGGVELGGWKPEPGVCDHCHQRRHRKKTYLLKNSETGEKKTLGSSCVKPFLGVSPNLKYLSYDASNLISEDDEMTIRYGKPTVVRDNREIIAQALAVSNSGERFLSKSAAMDHDGISTADKIGIFSDNPSRMTDEQLNEREKFLDLAYMYLNDGTVDKVMESANSIGEDSDYGSNVHRIIRNGWASERNIPTLVSIVGNYNRLKKREREEELKKSIASEKPSGFIGSEKERVRDLLIDIINVYKGTRRGFGYRAKDEPYSLVTARTKDNREIVWTQSGDTDLSIGDTANFTGTVKSHKVYKGNDQTNFSRAVVSRNPKLGEDGLPLIGQPYSPKPISREGSKIKKTRGRIEEIQKTYGGYSLIVRSEKNHRVEIPIVDEDLEKYEEGTAISFSGVNDYNTGDLTSVLRRDENLSIEKDSLF